MKLDDQAGTSAGTGQGGEAAGTAQADPKVSAEETSEQKIARLEAENSDKDTKLRESEELRLKNLSKVETANRIISGYRAGGTPPTVAAPAEPPPITREAYQRLVALANDPEQDQRVRDLAAGQIASLHASSLLYRQNENLQREAKLAKFGDEERGKIEALLDEDKASSVEDAARQLRLEKLTPLERENVVLREKVAKLEAEPARPAAPNTSGRGPGANGSARSGRDMTYAERERILTEGSSTEQWELTKAIREGKVKLID